MTVRRKNAVDDVQHLVVVIGFHIELRELEERLRRPGHLRRALGIVDRAEIIPAVPALSGKVEIKFRIPFKRDDVLLQSVLLYFLNILSMSASENS